MNRFWNKVNKTDGCWLWNGCIRGKSGYGCIKVRGKVLDTHRFSWMIRFGEIPKGKYVCHTCDNRLCVNPKHLFLGSPRDNVLDAISKNRFDKYQLPKSRIGKRPSIAKLNKTLANEIRMKYSKGDTTYRKLAKEYGVCYQTILSVIHNFYSYCQT